MPGKYSKYHELLMKVTADKLRKSLTDDALIIQAISNVNEVDKIANILSKRLREWYELHCPEFSKSISSNEKFSELVISKSRDDLLKEIKEKKTIGSDFSKDDLSAVKELAKQISELYGYKERVVIYIDRLMKSVCPNVLALTGTLVGAKLLMIAGSLKRLSEFPASTIQLLGAEKALFRHMKNKKHRPPKYGVLMQHPLVNKAMKKDKGKAGRMLADKISIAAKVDYFKGEFIGDKLKKELEKKLG